MKKTFFVLLASTLVYSYAIAGPLQRIDSSNATDLTDKGDCYVSGQWGGYIGQMVEGECIYLQTIPNSNRAPASVESPMPNDQVGGQHYSPTNPKEWQRPTDF